MAHIEPCPAKPARAGAAQRWEAEGLRLLAAFVGDTPDFRAERRALVLRSRELREQHQSIRANDRRTGTR